MSTKYKVSAASKVVTTEALDLLADKLSRYNPWMVKKMTSPNTDKLIDGAIQRVSVSPNRHALHAKVNTEKIGYYKSEELNERASRFAYNRSCLYDDVIYHRRIARIKHSEKSVTQCHPSDD